VYSTRTFSWLPLYFFDLSISLDPEVVAWAVDWLASEVKGLFPENFAEVREKYQKPAAAEQTKLFKSIPLYPWKISFQITGVSHKRRPLDILGTDVCSPQKKNK